MEQTSKFEARPKKPEPPAPTLPRPSIVAPAPVPLLPSRPVTISFLLVTLGLVVLFPLLVALAAQFSLSRQQRVFDHLFTTGTSNTPVSATVRPAGVEGEWRDTGAVAISRFAGGRFETLTTDTGHKLAEGSYSYTESDLVAITGYSVIRQVQIAFNCFLVSPGQLNCTSSAGEQFVMTRDRLEGEVVVGVAAMPDLVTALEWSTQPDGPLFLGTRAGRVFTISRDGNASQQVVGTDGGDLTGESVDSNVPAGPVVAFQSTGAEFPVFMVQSRTEEDANAIVSASSGATLPVQGSLFAAVPANNGSAVLGQSADQKSQVTPSETLHLSLFRDLNTATPVEVGEVFGVEDPRAVATLPRSNIVIIGDGQGNVYAMDASAQIAGTNPTQYIRQIGKHDAAIIEITVSANPSIADIRFATLAADRSVKVWRHNPTGDVADSPLVGYVFADVSASGSSWVEEPTLPQLKGMSDLLSMSRDGRRLLLDRGGDNLTFDLQIYDLPAIGETAGTIIHSGISGDSWQMPAILSPDGSRLLASNSTDVTIDLLDLTDVGTQNRPLPVIASFLAERRVTDLAFDTKGDRFLAIGQDGTIFVQSTSSPNSAPVSISDYVNRNPTAAISPDGGLVAICTDSGQLNFHSTADGQRLSQRSSCTVGGQFSTLAFAAGGRRLHAYDNQTATLATHSIRNPTRDSFLAFNPLLRDRHPYSFSGDGRRLIADAIGQLHIIDIGAQRDLATILLTPDIQWQTDWTASRIAVLNSAGQLRLFREAKDLTRPGPLPALREGALRLSSDGRQLFIAIADGRVGFAQLVNGRQAILTRPVIEPVPLSPVLDFAVAASSTVVSARPDGGISISQITLPGLLDSGEADPNTTVRPTAIDTVATITGHGGAVQAMALSPDGKLLATASIDGRVRITDLALARLVAWLPFSDLPTGPAVSTMQARPLANSPYSSTASNNIANSATDPQSASTGTGDRPALPSGAIIPGDVAGVWNVDLSGQTCKLATALTAFGSGFRSGALRCPAPVDGTNSWNLSGNQLILFDQEGNVLARLNATAPERFDGQTSSGGPITLSR